MCVCKIECTTRLDILEYSKIKLKLFKITKERFRYLFDILLQIWDLKHNLSRNVADGEFSNLLTLRVWGESSRGSQKGSARKPGQLRIRKLNGWSGKRLVSFVTSFFGWCGWVCVLNCALCDNLTGGVRDRDYNKCVDYFTRRLFREFSCINFRKNSTIIFLVLLFI